MRVYLLVRALDSAAGVSILVWIKNGGVDGYVNGEEDDVIDK